MAPVCARYSAWRCEAAITRTSERTAGAPMAARRSLCARGMSAASFDRAALDAGFEGDGVADPAGSGVAATAVGVAFAGELDVPTRADVGGACGLRCTRRAQHPPLARRQA